MKRVQLSSVRRIALLGLALLFLFSTAGSALAADKAKKRKVAAKKAPVESTISGDLTVAKGKKGKVSGATLKAEDGKHYKIVLDKVALKMAKEGEGKVVSATGTIAQKGTKKKPVLWLKVSRYTLAASPPAPPGDPAVDDEDAVEDVE